MHFETFTAVAEWLHEFVPFNQTHPKNHKISLQEDHNTGVYRIRVSRGKRSAFIKLDEEMQRKFRDLSTSDIVEYIKDHIIATSEGYELSENSKKPSFDKFGEITPNDTDTFERFSPKENLEEAQIDRFQKIHDELKESTPRIEQISKSNSNIKIVDQEQEEQKSEVGIVDLLDDCDQDPSNHSDIIKDEYDEDENNALDHNDEQEPPQMSELSNAYRANSNKIDLIRLMQDMTRYKQHKKRKALQNKKLIYNTHKVKINDNFNKPINMFVQSELLVADLTNSEAMNLRKHQIALKFTGIKFKREILVELTFIESTYDLASIILDKYGAYMNNRLAIKTSNMDLAFNRIPKKMIHYYDLIDEISGKTDAVNKNKQSTFYGYMSGPSFTEMAYPDYKPSEDLEIVKKAKSVQIENKAESVQIEQKVKPLKAKEEIKVAKDSVKSTVPTKQPEQSPEDEGQGEVDSELERMYAEYSREVDERINFGHDSESESPSPDRPHRHARPQTAKPVAQSKAKDYPETKSEDEDEKLDPELEELYAEYSHEVDDRLNFGHKSSSDKTPSEEIEYDPSEDDDEQVNAKIEELQRKMTEIRNKKQEEKVEDKVDIPESSVEYDIDSATSSEDEGEETHTKINLNHKISIKNLFEKMKNIDNSDKSGTIDLANEEFKLYTKFNKTFDDMFYNFNVLYNELDEDQYFWDEGVYKIEYKEDLDDEYKILIIKPKEICAIDDIGSGNFDHNKPFNIDFKQLIYEYATLTEEGIIKIDLQAFRKRDTGKSGA